jgi:hypothetical protein
MRPHRTVLLVLATAIVTSILTTTGVVVAGGGFVDVGPSHPFRTEIDAIVEAGITTGYEDGTYRPSAPVTRGAMAAFMERGFGRVAYASGTFAVPNPDTDVYGAGEVQITSGAAATGAGRVALTGNVSVRTEDPGTCPCAIEVHIRDQTTGQTSPLMYDTLGGDADEFTNAATSSSLSWVPTVPAGATRTYTLLVRFPAEGVTNVAATGTLTATYVPFDGSPGIQS